MLRCRTLAFCALVALAAARPLAFAQIPDSAPALPVHVSPTYFQLHMMLREMFDLKEGESVAQAELPLADAPAGSHLLLQYSSAQQAVILLARGEDMQNTPYTDFIYAVLPPGENQSVRIPLMLSRTWSGSREGLLIRIFARQENVLTVNGVDIGDTAGVVERASNYAGQFLQPEIFDDFTPNLLQGWSIATIPFTLIAGVLFFLLLTIVLIRKKNTHRQVVALCLIFMLLYQARFLLDLSVTLTGELRTWRERGTVRDLGDVYNAAAYFRALNETSEQPIVVALCDVSVATAFRYAAHPVPIVAGADALLVPTHAAMLANWKADNGSIACGWLSGSGRILATFPNGGAAATFSPHP